MRKTKKEKGSARQKRSIHAGGCAPNVALMSIMKYAPAKDDLSGGEDGRGAGSHSQQASEHFE